MRTALISTALLLLVAGASMAGNGPKVTICHVPPGNPGNEQTLSVGSSAVGAHLSNHPGDSIGACESSSGSSGSGSSSSGSSSSDCSDSSSGSSSSGSSSSGSSSSGSSGSGSGTCDGAGGSSGGGSGSGGDSGSSVSSYVIFAVRSTGSGGLTEQSSQVIVAELSFLLGNDENVYDIAVQNWRREH